MTSNLDADSVRVLIAKVGLDGHDVGARVVASGLAQCGIQVVYLGLRRTPEQIASAALQEDVDAVGISILSGAHLKLLPRVREALDAAELDDTLLIAGGIIPDQDIPILLQAGIAAIFHPGTPVPQIADYIRSHVREARTYRSHVKDPNGILLEGGDP